MLLDLRKEQFNLRFQRATGQLEALVAHQAGPPRHRAGEDHHRRSARAPPQPQA